MGPFRSNDSLTNHLDIVGHIHELRPLLDHLLPKRVGRRIVPLKEDGQLCDAAEEEGGQGGGQVGKDPEKELLCP